MKMKVKEKRTNLFFFGLLKAQILCLAMAVGVSGCAPMMRGAAAMSGGGSGGSTCDYEGFFRGSNCVNSVTNVYISDKNYGDKIPTVCGSLTTWGVFGSKHWQPGKECFEDLPSYCKSDILLPGFDNQYLIENDADTMAMLDKKRICATTMKAQVVIARHKNSETNRFHVWARMLGRDAMAKKVDIVVIGDELENYCQSDVIFPKIDVKVLEEYGVLKEANREKKKLCEDPERHSPFVRRR